MQKLTKNTGQVGFEPTTSGFGDRRSSRWSYWPVCNLLYFSFYMQSVLIVPFTVLLKLHLTLHIPPVFLSGVVTAVTLTAL